MNGLDDDITEDCGGFLSTNQQAPPPSPRLTRSGTPSSGNQILERSQQDPGLTELSLNLTGVSEKSWNFAIAAEGKVRN